MPLPRLRTPQEHGGVLALPPLDQAEALLELNRRRFAAAKLDLLGRSLSDVRSLAAREARAAAGQFLNHLGIPPPSQANSPLTIGGHQPELFHAGVWIKSFALQGLARKHGLTGLNLIVDNDNVKSVAIRVPDLSLAPVRTKPVAFDAWAGPWPFEELAVRDETAFAGFPDAIEAETRCWPFQPMVREFWQGAVAAGSRTKKLGERLAAARRRLEERWGCHNLELPLSRLCGTESFAAFACQLLAHLSRFRAVHNEALKDFRRRHRVRSRHHPVPELASDGEWLEAPFWAWKTEESRRHRLFVRPGVDSVELRAGGQTVGRVPRLASKQWHTLETWKEIEERGFKLRTRALTTTLFARLFVADLFIHGIGGAVYDELTDEIIRAFYGLEPPAFLVLSATVHLPFGEVSRPDPRELQAQLRDLWYNPDRHLEFPNDAKLSALCRQKQEWIQRLPADGDERRRRFQTLQVINDQLRRFAGGAHEQLEDRLAAARTAAETARVLQDREYAFCLFPEGLLRPLCEAFL